MYEDFFGLSEKPFSIQPDPSFLYWGRGHRLAYAMLEYGVLNYAGISVITGEVGCGKTTLIHRLLDQLSDTHSVALLSNIQEGRGDLLSWVLMAFGQPYAGKTHVELFADLQNFFISEYSKGRRTVLIIDEAQNLSVDQLEEIRMLSNINAGKDQLLQLILVGQPQLKSILNREDMLQLAQRVGADFHLTPLSREEVDAYIDTRLTIAGARSRIFAQGAVDVIAQHSRGVPRVINIICDTALVYAFSAHSKTVDAETVESVIRDKADYGVFGLAADRRTSLRSSPGAANAPQGPRLVSEETAAPRRPRADPPPLRAVVAEDQPRMTPPARRNSVAAARAAEPIAEDEAEAQAQADAEMETAAPAEPRMREGPELFPADADESDPEALEIAAEFDGEEADEVYEGSRGGAQPYVEAGAHAPPPLARRETVAPVESPARIPVVGAVVVAGAASPADALAAANAADDIVFVAQSTDVDSLEEARRAGADVVEIADRALTPGRARNAGYRQLKRRRPDLSYVQFVQAGAALDAAWLETAARFMERRPEVAAVEGRLAIAGAESNVFSRIEEIEANGEPGEVETLGPNALVRADAFEGAGGFRGDLLVNETRDLCIRLRRRGAHVWRLDAPMASRAGRAGSIGGWWSASVRRGYDYAHGAALHGAAPDHLFVGERGRALWWGFVFPLLVIVGAAVAAAAAYILTPFTQPLLVAGGVVGVGVLFYLVKLAVIAASRHGEAGAFAYAFWALPGRIAEAAGVLGYLLGGGRRRRQDR